MKFGFNLGAISNEEIDRLDTLLAQTPDIRGVELFLADDFANDMIDESLVKNMYYSADRLIKNHQLDVSLHFFPYDMATPSRRIQNALLDELRRACEFGAKYNTKIIVVHGGLLGECLFYPPGGQALQSLQQQKQNRMVNICEHMCAVAKQYDMTIALENIFFQCMLTKNADELKTFKSLIQADNLKFIFDTGHSNIRGLPCGDEIRKLDKDLVHLHLHDNHGCFDEHLPLGEGTIDWEDVAAALADISYQGLYLFELKEPTALNISKCYDLFKKLISRGEK